MAESPENPIKDVQFAPIPLDVLKNGKISFGARCAYGYLCSCFGNDGNVFPKGSTISKALGCSDRTTWRLLNELVVNGFIKAVKDGRRNSYKFIKDYMTDMTCLDSKCMTDVSHVDAERMTDMSHVKDGSMTDVSHVDAERMTDMSHVKDGSMTDVSHVDAERMTDMSQYVRQMCHTSTYILKEKLKENVRTSFSLPSNVQELAQKIPEEANVEINDKDLFERLSTFVDVRGSDAALKLIDYVNHRFAAGKINGDGYAAYLSGLIRDPTTFRIPTPRQSSGTTQYDHTKVNADVLAKQVARKLSVSRALTERSESDKSREKAVAKYMRLDADEKLQTVDKFRSTANSFVRKRCATFGPDNIVDSIHFQEFISSFYFPNDSV